MHILFVIITDNEDYVKGSNGLGAVFRYMIRNGFGKWR